MRSRCSLLCSAFFLAAFLGGCATKSGADKNNERNDNSKAHFAAYAAEGFYSDITPERDVTNWQFYFKNCVVESAGEYPKKTEWGCNGPH